MKKRIILCAVLLVSLALAILFGIVQFSTDNIENAKNEYQSLEISNPDGKIIVVDSYVNNIRLDGEINSTGLYALLIDANGEQQIVTFPIEVKNDDVYARVDRQIYSFAIIGSPLYSIESLTTNPTGLNVNFILFFFILLLPSVLAWAVLSAIEDKVSFKKDIFAMKRYKYLLSDLVTRDIKTKYRRSFLGVMWSVLNPLLMMLVLTAVFSQIIRVEVEGGFALFYLTGYIIFNFVSESSSFSLTSIISAGGLIKKVYIPKYIFPLEKTIFSLVNMFFSLIAFVIVFVIFLITGQVELHATMLLFFVPMLYVFVFAFGLNLILSTLNVFFRDVGHLWGVFLTVWMYATPIIYPLSLVPSWLQSIIKLNPLYYYVDYFRSIMIYGALPSLADNLICIGFALAFLCIGVTVFRKNQDNFVLHI